MHCSPIHQTSHQTVEGNRIVKHNFLFSNPHGLFPVTYLSFMCLKMVSRGISFITSCLNIFGSFLCFVKIQVIFLFSDFSNLSQLTQSFEDNQESSCNDISHCWAHVCATCQTLFTFTLLKCYPQSREVFLPSDTPSAFRGWDSSRLVLLLKTDAVLSADLVPQLGGTVPCKSSAACPSFSERPQASFPFRVSVSCILLKLPVSKELTAKQHLLQHYLGHAPSGHHI